MQPDKPAAVFNARLERAFRDAKAPGSLATPLTASPEASAELAVKHFVALLRDVSAAMARKGHPASAAVVYHLANEIDPLGPVMAALADGVVS